MKFEHTEVWGFKHALRGMRNPKNSWDRSDTICASDGSVIIGPNDMKLAKALISGGSEHRKFLRQIFVSVDITAPLYWWKEFDTYKVGTVANSTSTMHKLTSKPITRECFEMDDYCGDLSVQKVDQSGLTEAGVEANFKAHWHMDDYVDKTIEHLEDLRQDYLRWKNSIKSAPNNMEWIKYCEDKAYLCWKELVRWLPESWLQTRTVTLNYENLLSIYHQRKHHKLNEWSGKEKENTDNFMSWLSTLPYANEFIKMEFDKN